MLLRVDENDKIDRVENLQYYLDMEKWDAIVISDYNKGFLTSEDIFKISLYGDKNNILTFLDSKKQFKGNWFHHVDFIKINEKEYLENEGNFDGYKNQLIVTLGDRGARHFDKHLKGSFLYELEDKAEVRDLSGAGDTFLAAFVVNYLNTHDIASAIRYANKCASYVVTQKGVVVVDPSKID
jgi:D-beta-D-heptose 7-phosphate kinase/D-beta-D-heptose 1-phosphate adenosyltransferase